MLTTVVSVVLTAVLLLQGGEALRGPITRRKADDG